MECKASRLPSSWNRASRSVLATPDRWTKRRSAQSWTSSPETRRASPHPRQAAHHRSERMSQFLASRRTRLVLLLVVATAAITVLAAQAAGSSISYYLDPNEYLADPKLEGTRVRVAGRVDGGSVVERAGRPIAFEIFGDNDDRLAVTFEDGV